MEFDKLLLVPATSRHAAVPYSLQRCAFGESKDPYQVHRDVDGNDDEDEKVFQPLVRDNAIQRQGERAFASGRCDDSESGDEDRIEVDELEVVATDRIDMASKSERDNVGINRDGYHK